MEISGKIKHILDVKTGTSKSGKDWVSQCFILDTGGQYPKDVCIDCFGDNLVDQLSFYKVGYDITVKYNLESREFNDNWFTRVNAWNLAGLTRSKAKEQEDPFDHDNDPSFTSDLLNDNLPF